MASGTDGIFTLEEPDRGAEVAPTYDLATAKRGLTWTTHAHCDPDTADVICSQRALPANWRVGRRGREVVVALPASPARTTKVFTAKPDGTPTASWEINGYGRVTTGTMFDAVAASQSGQPPGQSPGQAGRFTSREPSGSNALHGCGSMAFTLDAQRRTERLRCLQWSGDPMLDINGVAATRFIRDTRGFVVEVHHEGLDGKPRANVDGIAGKRFELDRDGRIAVVRYLDVLGKPVAAARGCHGYRYERHPTNTVAKETCLDARDRPANAVNAIAVKATRVDARGCATGSRVWAVDGLPAVDDDGVHRHDRKVDRACSDLAEQCHGPIDEPIACGADRPSRYVTKRDSHGNAVSVKHYAPDGTEAGDDDYGVFELRYRYDPLDRAIGESCFDADAAPVECGTTGIHATQSIFDTAGRIVEERFFDEHGERTTNLGTSIRRFVYDNYDHQFEETNYDAAGQIMEMRGQATRRDLYDANHRIFAVLMLDRTGSPATYEGCYTGTTCPLRWHAVRLVRRTDGTIERNQFFDKDGRLIESLDCKRVACFD